jgi:D-alanyl-D-alanine dipeptidase
MRKTILPTLAFMLLALACATTAGAKVAARKGTTPLARARQLILVTTRDWTAVQGTLQRFERKSTGGAWRRVGAAVPVVVGRGGLGWGEGLNMTTRPPGDVVPAAPAKKEGDGRAPAGVFRLGHAFGFAPRSEASWLRMPYMPLAPSVECVDDVASRHYNLIVDRDALKSVDWNSSERMRSVEGYRWGLVVEHNADAPVPGRGSCIFLHIWASPEKGTAGCTAMEQTNLEELLRWLDSKKLPLLVQLPEGEYTRLRTAWRLPRLDGK